MIPVTFHTILAALTDMNKRILLPSHWTSTKGGQLTILIYTIDSEVVPLCR